MRESVNNASHFIDINIIGTHHPFLLAYHDHNNKMLMQKYGQIYQKLIEPFQKNLIQQRSASIPNGKINLGIISNHFFNHSVWSAITKGLVFNLDRSRFNLHLFSTNSRSDNETIMAKNCATSFSIHSTPQGLAASILDKKIEALIFPEIGMDKLTIQIASLNLAPIQIVSWGHPETTGIPSINYFLGGELFESKHSSDNYSELLLSLPNLGCYLEPYVGPIEEVNLIELGINPRAPKLLCPGAPFKYHPDYDWVLVEISKQNPSAQFIFFEFPNSGVELLRTRLANRFNTEGLHQNINSLKFIPILDGPHFRGLMKQMTLYLDTIGFSGFNTALQAIESDLPIITREGHFMRGNLAAGLLKRVKMPYLVAKDNASYIKLVTDLIANPQLLKEYSKLISLNRSALYHDLMPIRELEKFLLDKCRPHGIELNEY